MISLVVSLMENVMIVEKEIKAPNGIMMLFVLLTAQIVSVLILIGLVKSNPVLGIAGVLLCILVFICWFGLFMVNPKEGKVLQLFGKYAGTVHDTGYAGPIHFIVNRQFLCVSGILRAVN